MSIIKNSQYIVNVDNKDTIFHFETNSGQVLTKDGNLDATLDKMDLSKISSNILPSTTSSINIGSTDKRFKSIYVDEVFLAANTLYVDGVPVIGSRAETIEIKADKDQGLLVKTLGLGSTKITSENNVEISTSNIASNIDIKSLGSASKVNISSASQINIDSPNINILGELNTKKMFVSDLIVNGDLTVKGVTTTLNSQNLTVKDNIIEINSGEIGSGVTAGEAGIKINRGDSNPYFILFDETDDLFKLGEKSALQIIATRDYVESKKYIHPLTHDANIIVENSSKKFVSDAQINTWNNKANLNHQHTKADISDFSHSHNEYINQNAFSQIKVGTNIITADSPTDLLELVPGANIVLTPDINTDKLTISAVDTIYTHPSSHNASMIIQDSNNRFVTDAQINTWNSKATTSYVDSKISELVSTAPETLDTLAELSKALGNDPNFATSISTEIGKKVDKIAGKGLSSEDYTLEEKNKLKGIADNANNYVHPSTSGNKHIPSGGVSGQFLKWSADGTAVWANDNNTTYTASNGISLTGNTFGHSNNIVAGSTSSSSGDLIAGGILNLPKVNYDVNGHITSVSSVSCKLPEDTKPGTLKTDNTTSQTVSTSESLTGNINLHKISKTGNYNDLLNKPTSLPASGGDSHTVDGYHVDDTKTGNDTTINNALWTANKIKTQLDNKSEITHTHDYAPHSHISIVATNEVLGHVKSSNQVTIQPDGSISINDNSHNHTITNVTGLQTALNNKSDVHLHPYRLDTWVPSWTEVTGKPSTFTPSAHNQPSSTITTMTGYAKATTSSAIATTDTLNSAIGKLEKGLDTKSDIHDHPYKAIDWVPTWTEVTGKPSTFTPSSHNQTSNTITGMTGYTKAVESTAIVSTDNLNTAIGKLEKGLDGKSDIHSHPYKAIDWLPTWAEVTGKPSTFAPATHNQSANTITSMTGYVKATEASIITTSDSLNTAIGKLEKGLEGKSDTHSHPYRADTWVPSWTEVTSKPSSFTPSAHNQSASTITTMTGYTKSTSFTPIITTDNLNSAIGKLEKGLDTKSDIHDHPYRLDSWVPTWNDVTSKPTVFTPATHTHNEYINQNSFANIKVGTDTIVADSVSDTLEFVAGANINIVADTLTDKLTISANVPAHPSGLHVTQIEKDTWNSKETTTGAQAKATAAQNEAIKQSNLYTDTKVAALINGAPEQLDTLKELADAVGSNQAGVSDLLTEIGKKSDKTYVDTELAKKSDNHTHPYRLDTWVPSWAEVTSKPSTFAPAAHNQASNTITTMAGYAKAATVATITTTDTLNSAIGKLEKGLDSKSDIHDHPYKLDTWMPSWSEVTSKPSTFTPSAHNQASNTITGMTGYTKATSFAAIAVGDNLNTAIGKLEKGLDTKSDIHTHPYRADSWVPTWAEVTGKPTTFTPATHTHDYAPTSHNQTSNTITSMTGYTKATVVSSIAATDSLNVAIGKLEKGLDSKSDTHSHPYRLDTWVPSWGEVTSKPSTFTPTAHNQASNTITSMTGYTKASAMGDIVATDSLNVAIGKLEKSLDDKSSLSHTHELLTRGNYLTGSNYNGGIATTWSVDATSNNTANKVVARDASGNFSAGTITANLSGNSTTATKLQTARTINGVSFDGTTNITITASTPNLLTRGSYLTGSNFNGDSATTWAVDATPNNTASKVVARDASGNFSAGTVTVTKISTNTINSTSTLGILNGSSAQRINTGGVLASDNYSDQTKVPTNGIYSKGDIYTDGTIKVNAFEMKYNESTESLEFCFM